MKKSKRESTEYIDDLTGIYNRRYLKKKQKEIASLQRKNIPYSVVMVDIDHFKEINDTYGHLKGDEVIKEFSQFLTAAVRKGDIVVRYGGDEFVCVMVNSKRQDTEYIYNRILESCKKRNQASTN